MCGIVGFVDHSKRFSTNQLQEIARQMGNAIRHRGPDDSGEWIDENAGIALSHRRLSILDLSVEGHQPKQSNCGRYVISFNGEIYNFLDLKSELEAVGHQFAGRSDTEVMLSSFSQWGVFEGLKRLNGMFACALWDRQERLLHLARDRAGEKPIYYGWQGHTFFFASELKGMKPHPDFKGEVSRTALELFIHHNYVPTPFSIYEGIRKLRPGHLLTLNPFSSNHDVKLKEFWSFHDMVDGAVQHPFNGTATQAVKKLDEILSDAVKIRMQSDVPFGAFLSGGIDSSTIVALMQKQSGRPISTFTIGFTEGEFNEAKIAKEIAAYLGTDHTEFYLTPREAMDVIPLLPHLWRRAKIKSHKVG